MSCDTVSHFLWSNELTPHLLPYIRNCSEITDWPIVMSQSALSRVTEGPFSQVIQDHQPGFWTHAGYLTKMLLPAFKLEAAKRELYVFLRMRGGSG